MRATVITDASWCPDTKVGGWAAWISPDIGARVQKSGIFKQKVQNSSEAEIQAAINGCMIAYAMGARTILLQSDCLAISSAMEKRPMWKKRQALHFPDAKIRYRHVKGHTSNSNSRSYVNRWCDAEARAHMRVARKGVTP